MASLFSPSPSGPTEERKAASSADEEGRWQIRGEGFPVSSSKVILRVSVLGGANLLDRVSGRKRRHPTRDRHVEAAQKPSDEARSIGVPGAGRVHLELRRRGGNGNHTIATGDALAFTAERRHHQLG